MKVAIGIGSAYYNGDDWDELVDYTVAADQMGVDYVWSAEAWGMDAIVPWPISRRRPNTSSLAQGSCKSVRVSHP